MAIKLKKIELTDDEYGAAYSNNLLEPREQIDLRLSIADMAVRNVLEILVEGDESWTPALYDRMTRDALFIARVKIREGKGIHDWCYKDFILNKVEGIEVKPVIVSDFYKQVKEMDIRKQPALRFIDTSCVPEVRMLQLLS